MPKRRCSPAEEAANLERRATETNIRLGKKRVTLAMNSCPSCIPHLVSKLESLGYTTERLSQREPVAQSFQALAASRRKVKQEEPATAPKADDDDEHDNKDFAAVPTKYWRLDALSKNLLRDRLVCAIEPVILSPANLRVHLDKEGTTTAREHLLEILEATTGVPRTMPITGDMRDWLKLTQELVSRAQVRGRRALRITFPLNWDTFLFTIVGADESGHCVLVEQNFNGFPSGCRFRRTSCRTSRTLRIWRSNATTPSAPRPSTTRRPATNASTYSSTTSPTTRSMTR